MKRRVGGWALILGLMLAGCRVPGGGSAILPGSLSPLPERKVFVNYLPWFSLEPEWDHWRWSGHDPNLVGPDGRRQIAAANYPAIGPYDSLDDGVIAYHLLLMQAAGFDGAIVNWYGAGNRIDEATRALFAKTEAWRNRYGFQFSLMLMADGQPYIYLDDDQQITAARRDLQEILATYAQSPVYQYKDGKPVLYFYLKDDPNPLTPAEWQQIRQGITPPFHLSFQHLDERFKSVAQMAYGWISGFNGNGTHYGRDYLDWLYPTFDSVRQGGWAFPVATGIVYAGFDDSGVYAWSQDPSQRRWIRRTIDDRPTLELTWGILEQHLRRNPRSVEWVQLATWNDWNEGSQIEPSREWGTSHLELAARKNADFKGGKAAGAEAWAFAQTFLERRRQGVAESEMEEALRLFAQGDHAGALAHLEGQAKR